MKTTILISGSSGMLGQQIVSDLAPLLGEDLQLLAVGRAPQQSGRFYLNIQDPAQSDSLPEGKLIWINLNGAGIADARWSEDRKDLLIQSRVSTTQAIQKLLESQGRELYTYIGASAVGVYGLKNSSKKSFLKQVCQLWEAAHRQVPAEKKVIIRIPVILSSQGGALSKMLLPFKLGMGGPIGSGQQKFPWIHLQDLSQIFLEYLQEERLALGFWEEQTQVITPLPEKVPTQLEFAKTLASLLKRPAWAPLPSLVVKILFGQMGEEALLGDPDLPTTPSSPGLSQRKFTSLETALKDCLK